MPHNGPAAGATVPQAPGETDGETFASLYARLYPRLLAYCRTQARDAAAAEDLAQETLLRVFTRFDVLELRLVWPWMKKVAANLAVDHARKLRREVPLEELRSRGVLDGIGRAEDRHDLAGALSRLSPRQQTAVELRFLQDRDPAEAASFLRLSQSAFKQLLYRARESLRAEYRRASRDVAAMALFPLMWLRRVARGATRQTRKAAFRARVLACPASPVLQLATVLAFSVVFVSPSAGATAAVGTRSGASRLGTAVSDSASSLSPARGALLVAVREPVAGAVHRGKRGSDGTSSGGSWTGCAPVDRESSSAGGSTPGQAVESLPALGALDEAAGTVCSGLGGLARIPTADLLRSALVVSRNSVGRMVNSASTVLARPSEGLYSTARKAPVAPMASVKVPPLAVSPPIPAVEHHGPKGHHGRESKHDADGHRHGPKSHH